MCTSFLSIKDRKHLKTTTQLILYTTQHILCRSGGNPPFHRFFSGTLNYDAFYHFTVLGGIIRTREHVKPRAPTGQKQMEGSTAVSRKEKGINQRITKIKPYSPHQPFIQTCQSALNNMNQEKEIFSMRGFCVHGNLYRIGTQSAACFPITFSGL